MPTEREPWIKVKLGIRRSDKLASLPSDVARLGWFYVLLEAKVQRRMGVFANRAHFAEVMGRFARFYPDYVRAGLLHEAPNLCQACATRHPDLAAGAVIVHDYLKEQRDPTNADRQLTWTERHNAEANGAGNAPPNGTNNARPNAKPNGLLTRAGNDRDGDSDDSLSEEDRSSLPSRAEAARSDVQALLDRGWRGVTPKQMAILDEVLDLHDVTGPDWAARIIRRTPGEHDPLDAVKQAHARWQTERRDATDRDEASWLDVKATDREQTTGLMARLEARP